MDTCSTASFLDNRPNNCDGPMVARCSDGDNQASFALTIWFRFCCDDAPAPGVGGGCWP